MMWMERKKREKALTWHHGGGDDDGENSAAWLTLPGWPWKRFLSRAASWAPATWRSSSPVKTRTLLYLLSVTRYHRLTYVLQRRGRILLPSKGTGPIELSAVTTEPAEPRAVRVSCLMARFRSTVWEFSPHAVVNCSIRLTNTGRGVHHSVICEWVSLYVQVKTHYDTVQVSVFRGGGDTHCLTYCMSPDHTDHMNEVKLPSKIRSYRVNFTNDIIIVIRRVYFTLLFENRVTEELSYLEVRAAEQQACISLFYLIFWIKLNFKWSHFF